MGHKCKSCKRRLLKHKRGSAVKHTETKRKKQKKARNQDVGEKRESTSENKITRRDYLHLLMNQIRYRNNKWPAFLRNLDFGVDYLELLWDLQDGHCAKLKNVKLTWLRNNLRDTSRNPFNASVDRIDNDRPYSRDNIQLVCVLYQIAKNEWRESLVESLFSLHSPPISSSNPNPNPNPFLLPPFQFVY